MALATAASASAATKKTMAMAMATGKWMRRRWMGDREAMIFSCALHWWSGH
jgi:hypothetical protein